MPVDRERERDGRQVLVEIFFYGNSIHHYVRTTELRIRVTRTSSIADSLRGRSVTREFDIRESRLFGGIRSTGSFESPRANNQDRIGEEGHQCKWRYYHRSPSSYVTCQHRSPASARRYQPWNRLLPIRIWLRVIFFFRKLRHPVSSNRFGLHRRNKKGS